jgi:FkbM family methyltransferase
VIGLNWRSVPSKIFWVIELELRSYFTQSCGFKYAWNKWISVLFNKKSIPFLGVNFEYFDRLNPFSIFLYVNEVKNIIGLFGLNKIIHQPRVLEIGGNIGNWGISLCHFLPAAKLYTFEPNPQPFGLLKKNSSTFTNWKIFNFGVGSRNELINFYVVPNKSGQGSIYEQNANKNLLSKAEVEKIQVSLIKFDRDYINSNLDCNKFDFIKIDVEGAEWEVIHGLCELNWKGMYIELSLDQMGRDSVEKFVDICKGIWPKVQIAKLKRVNNNVVDLFLVNLGYQ